VLFRSLYVQPNIGGDIALLTGIAKCVLDQGCADEAFIDACTDGSQAFLDNLRNMPWRDIVEQSGVSKDVIERVASKYAESERTVFAWTMGITHHVHGVQNVQAIINLALLRGMVGKVGAGLLPIRGHSNVQGVGSVGVTPALKQAYFDALESHYGVKLPTSKGLDTMACMEAADSGTVKAGWCLGGNLYGSNPDAQFAKKSLAQLESIVYFSTTLNTGHAHGRAKETLILPVLARDEEAQPTTQESMFSFVRLSDGGMRRHQGPRSEVEIIAEIAHGVMGENGPVDWRTMRSHRQLREAIGAVVPGYEKVATIDRNMEEFQLKGRTYHRPIFNTSNSKAKFHVLALPKLSAQVNGKRKQLRLMTIRSEGQFNTVVYEENDLYRNQDRRDVILLNAEDIRRFGLETDQAITVRSIVGAMSGILVRPFDIRAGNAAMYYPEANVLVPKDLDPQSRTPAFKNVAITIEI